MRLQFATPVHPIQSSISCVELLNIELFPFFPNLMFLREDFFDYCNSHVTHTVISLKIQAYSNQKRLILTKKATVT